MLRHSHRFPAIGTSWEIRTADALPRDVADAVAERIDRFDRTWSRFRADSLVAAAARGPVSIDFPEDAAAMMSTYRELYEITGGAVTPLVGGAMEHLGYDADYRLVARDGAAVVPPWDDAMSWTGTRMTTNRPLVLDVGAAGKGHLVDLVVGVLADAGITDALVDAGGDLRHTGPDVLRIGLEHPADPRLAVGVASLSGRALCASAGNRRRWGPDLHHVVDGRTGRSTGSGTGQVVATWVIADTGLVADALATALFFVDPSALDERPHLATGTSWVRLLAGGRIEHSPNFEGETFR